MLLEVTKMRNSDGPQKDEELSGLELTLKDLSIKDSKDEIFNSDDSDDDKDNQKKEECLEEKEDVKEENDIPSCKNEEDTDGTDEDVSEKERGILDGKKSGEVDLDTKEKTEEKVIHEKAAEESVDKEIREEESTIESEDEVCPEESKKEESLVESPKEESVEETENDESAEETQKDDSTEEQEDKASKENLKDECAKKVSANEVTPVVKEKKFLARGLGSGTSEQQHSPYMFDHGYNNFTCGMSADAPIPYSPYTQMFQATSPQQATTPTYLGMAGSPLPAFTDSNVFSPMQNCNIGFCDGGMTMDGSPIIGVHPYSLPESPCLIQDENVMPQQTCMVPDEEYPDIISSLSHTPEDVLEAISRVENSPQTSVHPGELDDIKKKLQEVTYEGNTLCSDYPETSLVECENFRAQMMDYSFNGLPSPPLEYEGNAEQEMLCKIPNRVMLEKTLKNVGTKTNEFMTQKDEDGDHPFMVVACQKEDSEKFYRDFYAVACRVKDIKICCEEAICMNTKACRVCLNTNWSTFYSPLAMQNKEGDTVLRGVIRTQQSELVIKFLCEIINHSQLDIDRIFSAQDMEFYRSFVSRYPVLGLFLQNN